MKNAIQFIKTKANNFKNGVVMGMMTGMSLVSGVNAAAPTVTVDEGTTAESAMGAVIGVVLTIMRYVGVAMVIYGIYEIVMSIQNNQPEAKTKGIIMALSGVVMIAIKSLISAFGIHIS